MVEHKDENVGEDQMARLTLQRFEDTELSEDSPRLELDLLGGSDTVLDIAAEAKKYPAQLQRDSNEDERDINRTRDVAEREQVFRHALPDRYEVLHRLGRGHSGSVFAALELQSDGSKRPIAIKYLESQKAGFINRRTREFSSHRFLPPHENIVQLISKEKLNAGHYEFFTMELCEMSLADWIAQKGQERRGEIRPSPALSPIDTLRVLHDLFDVLNVLRDLAVMHRDIGPANILLQPHDNLVGGSFPYKVKLADFGVADMLVVPGVVRPSFKYFGVWKGDGERGYTFDDDFRAVVAAVFVAWIGETRKDKAHGNVSRAAFLSQDEFEESYSRLSKTEEDLMILGFFERALPMERMFEEAYGFKEAIHAVENLGDGIHGSTSWRRTKIEFKEQSKQSSETLRNRKLEVYVRTALSGISSRRYATDFDTAKRYLLWASFLKDQFDETNDKVPNEVLNIFHNQWAMIYYLEPLRAALKDFEVLCGQDANRREDDETSKTRERIEDLFICLKKEIKEGKKYADVSEANKLIPPGTLLETMTTLEEIRYYKADKSLKQAAIVASERFEQVLALFQNIRSGELSAPETKEQIYFNKRCFQLCRQTYLLIREAMEVSKKLNDASFQLRYAKRAVQLCQIGVMFVRIDPGISKGDKLEMGRCLVDALYIYGQDMQARLECRSLYKEFAIVAEERVRLLRVVAIWVASLKRLCADKKDTDLLFEFGYACSILNTVHREAAIPIVENDHGFSNGQLMLASDLRDVPREKVDYLVDLPFLPPVELVLADSKNAMESLKTAQKGKKGS